MDTPESEDLWPSRGSVLLRSKRDRSRLHRARSSRLARLQDRYIPLFHGFVCPNEFRVVLLVLSGCLRPRLRPGKRASFGAKRCLANEDEPIGTPWNRDAIPSVL